MKIICRRNIKTDLLALFIAGTAALTAACSGAPTAPTSGGGSGSGPAPGTSSTPAVVGAYRLSTVNGHPVPGPFDSFSPDTKQTMQMEARSGLIVMNDDGTFTHDRETRLVGTNVPQSIVSRIGYVGLYTLQDSVLTMTPYQGAPLKVTFTPGQIQIFTTAPGLDGRDDTFVWSYRK
jgi:hypothetical protein